MDSARRIGKFIRDCRRRILLQEALAGTATLAVVAFGSLFLAGLVAEIGIGSPAMRTVLLGAMAAGVGWGLYRHLFRPWARLASKTRLARELERRFFSENRLEWVSAVQLAEDFRAPSRRSGVSRGLVEAHLDSVAGQMAGTQPTRVVDPRRLKRPLLVFILAASLFGLLCIARPGAVPAAAEILFGSGESSDSQSRAVQTSWVGDIDLVYRYPAYTSRRDKRIEGTDGSILALPGTRVTIESMADRRIARARLEMDEGSVPLEISEGDKLTGELTVMNTGSYRFVLQDAGGHSYREMEGHPVRLEQDDPPRVELNKPEKDLQIRNVDALEILYSARDDFGLSQVRLVWRVVGRAQGEQRRVLRRYGSGRQRVSRRSFRWELAPLDLEPGDRLQFFIEAVDNDSVNGPKTGRSATCNVKVFSADEHHAELMRRAQAIWEKLLAGLADTLDLDPRAGGIQQGTLQDFEKLHSRADELLTELERFVPRLRDDRLAHEPLVSAIRQVTNRLSRLQSGLAMLLRPTLFSADRRRNTARLLEAHCRLRISRLEKDVLYLEDLLDVVRLKEIERLAKELEDSRKRLATLMEQYAAAPDEEVRRQIESEIARMKEKIADLLRRQREVLKGVRDEYFNPDALAKMMSDRDMLGALDKVQRLLAEGKVEEAMAEMARLQKQVADLQSAIGQSLADYGSGRYAELAQQVARAMGELNMIAESQRKLKDATGDIRDRLLERLKQRDDKSLKEFFEKQRARLAEIGKRIDSIPSQWPDAYADRNRQRSRQQVRLLDLSLKARDLAGSLESGEDLVEAVARLVAEIEFAQRYAGQMSGDKRKEIERHLKNAKRASSMSRAIYEALKKIMPDPRRMLRNRERNQLEELARRQAELRSRLRALRRQMQKIDESAPIFGQEAMGRMARGGHHMGQASSSLEGKRPGRAHPQQQNALAELEALKQAIDKSCQGGKCGGMPMPLGSGGSSGRGGFDWGGPGGNPDDRDIEIPDPEDYQPPEAFRRALLEGMKDPVPEDFKQQVRRYYEELVR